VRAVVLDLFGTLVDAPAAADRRDAAIRLARAAHSDVDETERYLVRSWRARHDGTLRTTEDVADDLVGSVCGRRGASRRVAATMLGLARRRLGGVDPSVLATARALRDQGTRLGLLSDASPEIAEAWPQSPLAPFFSVAVFSSTSGAVKPDRRLYREVTRSLGVPPDQALFCGDGGGDELAGAAAVGMRALRVNRRGPAGALAFGEGHWSGPSIAAVEALPDYLGLRVAGG